MTSEQLGPGVICVRMDGEFDLPVAYAFDEQLKTIEAGDPRAIVVDMRDVSFVDSAGLARILAASRRAQQAGRRFVLVRGCRPMERLLALTALGHSLEMVTDPQAVITAG